MDKFWLLLIPIGVAGAGCALTEHLVRAASRFRLDGRRIEGWADELGLENWEILDPRKYTPEGQRIVIWIWLVNLLTLGAAFAALAVLITR
jgi:hypothetical protein